MNLISTLTHGHSRRGQWTPEYYAWASMIQRCTNPARNVYHLYGGRGIQVCERWRSFEHFLADIGARPPGTSLGRIDPDGNYCPENCEWQTATKQARERRNNKLNEVAAKEMCELRESGLSFPEIGRRYGVSKTMARNVVLGRAWA